MRSLVDYARERDDAFRAFVEDGDFTHIDKLTAKWSMRPIPHDDVGRAAVFKAVQECVNIEPETKAKAFALCAELGFFPFALERRDG